MAGCRCRCLRCLRCLLLSFALLGLLFIYAAYDICTTMNHHAAHLSMIRFIAPGLNNTTTLASYPIGPFWNIHPDGGAFWNGLQVPLDRKRNPILRGPKALTKDAEENVFSLASTNCSQDQDLISILLDFKTWPVQMQKFVLSMHCREHLLLLDQPYTCGSDGKEAPMLLMVIKSQEGNFENRQTIRQTWGREGWVKGLEGDGAIVRRIFLLGKQDASAKTYADVADLLELEKGHYQDILQWDFQDTFFNLTLKDVLFWHWFSHRCPRAHFIFKGDDDVFVRTPALLDTLGQVELKVKLGSTWKMKDFIIGDVIKNAPPVRETTSKYYIPKSFYKGLYPPYAGGGGVGCIPGLWLCV